MGFASCLALGIALGGTWGAVAQTVQNQVNISMCSWNQLRANVIRDTIYLDGGDLMWLRGLSDGTNDGPSLDETLDGTVFTLQLGKSFNTEETNLTALFEPLAESEGPANDIAPATEDGVMFANDYKFYLYGGLIKLLTSVDNPPDADEILTYERYQYGPAKPTFEKGFDRASTGDEVNRYVTHGAGVSAPSEQLGFYFSGMRGEEWGEIREVRPLANVTSDRLISVDMSEWRQEVWSNDTIPDFVPLRAKAEMVWVPVSDSGVLIAIGGVRNPEDIFSGSAALTEDQIEENNSTGPNFMRSLPVYDIANGNWYMQNTTGSHPPALSHFCSVMAAAPDGSSFNIYIYGGYDGTDRTQRPSNVVYVLSVPSFTWVKVYEGESHLGRSGHRCVKTYPDKMFVLGGMYMTAGNCIPSGIMRVFNLNTLKFQDVYDPEDWEEYKVPDLVSAQIDGNGPEEWADDDLSEIFGTEYTKTINTYYPYSATATPTPTDSESEGGGGGLPSWVGPVLGVVLGLIVISLAVIFWLLWRRRRRAQQPQDAQSVGAISDNRKRILGWMYGVAQPAPKPDMTTTSTEIGINEKPTYGGASEAGHESVMSPHATSTVVYSDTNAQEAGSVAVHEMHADQVAPMELPTDYNVARSPSFTRERHLSDTPSYQSGVSPAVSPSPESQQDREQTRAMHARHHSSISSAGFPVSLDDAIARDDTEQGGHRQVSAFVEDLPPTREEPSPRDENEPRPGAQSS